MQSSVPACADVLLSKVPLYSRELRLVAVPVSREDRFPRSLPFVVGGGTVVVVAAAVSRQRRPTITPKNRPPFSRW